MSDPAKSTSRRMPFCAVLVLALALIAGCDSREADGAGDGDPSAPRQAAVAKPLAAAVGDRVNETRVTSVPFVTLRNRTGDSEPSTFYGDERDGFRSGRCEVTWTPIRVLDRISENSPIYIPSEDQEITAIIETPVQSFWDEFAGDNSQSRPLLYVHGYNIGFEKGCYRAARFIDNLGLGRRLVLFSWPSDGAALNYTRDEADLEWSVKHLRETMMRMEHLFGRGGFDVVGHSLGGRGLAQALADTPALPGSPQPLVERLVLIAADVDAAVFEQMLPRLARSARHITAYVSGSDNALALSREIHGYPRLGEAGAHLVGLSGVELIDVSELPLRRVSGHLYHLYNEPVILDLRELLNDGLAAADRTLPQPVDPTVPNYWQLPEPAE